MKKIGKRFEVPRGRLRNGNQIKAKKGRLTKARNVSGSRQCALIFIFDPDFTTFWNHGMNTREKRKIKWLMCNWSRVWRT